MKYYKYVFAAAAIIAIVVTGCKNDPASNSDASMLYEDAAESISAAMGDESGGAMESFADVMNVAGGGSIDASFSKTSGDETISSGTPVYDETTGWWTVTINRSRSNNFVSASIDRVYRFQFLKNGVFQKFRIAERDTATTLKFKIVSGSGYFRNLRVKHNLTDVRGGWTVTDIDKDTVTVNSDTTYVRSGVDSVITRNMTRTFTHTTTMEFSNIRGPRFRPALMHWRENFHQAVSGTVTGRYTATITFERGDGYKERSIDRTFTIVIEDGNGDIAIDRGGQFRCDMSSGERKP